MHGFALNCDPDMTAFGNMVPCGIPDAGVTSLSAELGRDVPVAEAIEPVERRCGASLDRWRSLTACSRARGSVGRGDAAGGVSPARARTSAGEEAGSVSRGRS